MINFNKIMRDVSWKVHQLESFFQPHNVVKAKQLPKTWVDRDHLMFHVCFQILVDFVEQEEPYGATFTKPAMMDNIAYLIAEDPDYPSFCDEMRKEQYERSKEVIELYLWYKYIYPSLENKTPEQIDFSEKQENEMLDRLIKVRKALWT